MNNKQNHRNNNRKGTKPRGYQLRRTRNLFTQNANAASRQDAVPQVRKFQIFQNLPFSNATSDYAIGLENFNISAGESPFQELLKSASGLYEQYRVRKVIIRAQVGKGYTNDYRLKTLVGCRVDVAAQLSGATMNNVQAINASENTVIRTFTERGNVKLAEFRPQCRTNTGGSTDPLLPSPLQWYPIASTTHIWKGATVTCMIPEPSLPVNSLGITLIAEVDVEFRGRVTAPVIFSGTTGINQSSGSVPSM